MSHPLRFTAMAGLVAALGGCSTSRPADLYAPDGSYAPPSSYATAPQSGFAPIPYSNWAQNEPDYRMYPGDVLDVLPPSAPELARTVTVQPDGRISLPMIGAVMAADRSVPELDAILTQAYATQLRRPEVEVTVKAASPLKVFVGGEVDKPGVYDMPGDIDALQAVVMAGGFKTSAKTRKVIVIRRGPEGRAMMRTVDLNAAVRHAGGVDAVPLRRFDIIYVPRSGIADFDLFVQQYLRDALPVQFSYALNGQYVSTH